MNEFNQVIKLMEAQIKESVPELEILSPWENISRKNPQSKAVAVIAVSKLSVLPAALGEICSENLSKFRKVQISFQLSFCTPNASRCWEIWERCMDRIIFSSGISLLQAECREAVWKKEWGGVVLPVELCCEFLLSKDQRPEPMPDKIKIIKKGEI